jgi:NADPH:quinone reductase
MFCLASKYQEVHVIAEICMPHAIQIRQTGGPEVLNWTAVDVGEPGLGQVRLRHAAAGLNYIDVYHRTGYYAQPLPFIPGLEGAGTVEAVAADVRGLKVGDRVAYAGPTGGYSEVRLIEADRLVRLPEAISFDQAAAMMVQGMTAQVLIRQVYTVKAGDLILVHAAAGGTGLILCQWATALGFSVSGRPPSAQRSLVPFRRKQRPKSPMLTAATTRSSIRNRIS